MHFLQLFAAGKSWIKHTLNKKIICFNENICGALPHTPLLLVTQRSKKTAFLYTKIINYTTNFVKYFWNKSIILFYTFLIYKNCIFFTKTYLINYNTMIKTVLVHYVNYKVIFLFSSTESKTIQLAPITEFLPITVSPPNIEALAYIVT